MSPLDILRRVTKPMPDAEVEAMMRRHYSPPERDNIGNEDLQSLRRAERLLAQAKDKIRPAAPGKKVAAGR